MSILRMFRFGSTGSSSSPASETLVSVDCQSRESIPTITPHCVVSTDTGIGNDDIHGLVWRSRDGGSEEVDLIGPD